MTDFIDLPVYRRSKGVVAWAKVSPDDYARVSKYRWYLEAHGYVRRVWYVGKRPDVRQRAISLHVEIMGKKKGKVVDHFNGDKLDCRRENLRFVGRTENRQNTPAVRSDSQSGVKGVYKYRYYDRWVAYSSLDGRRIYLGSFADIEDAAEAVKEFRREHLSIHKAFV